MSDQCQTDVISKIPRALRRRSWTLAPATMLAAASYLSVAATAPPSLKSVQVLPVPGIEKLVRDEQSAIVLGKALFWDTAVGRDGNSRTQ